MQNSNLTKNIVTLKLPRSNLGDQGALFIFTSEMFHNLKKVDVSSNQITPTGCEAIASENRIDHLEVINTFNNKIGNAGFEALIQSTKFPKLTDLRLDMTKIT